MDVQTILEQLGYHANEIKIYLAALEMGEINITELASQAGLPRTTVREHVEEMLKKGLLNHYEKHGRTFYMAGLPSRLLAREKEREAALSLVLPDLEAIKAKNGIQKPTISTFYGVEEIKEIFKDMIETKHHIMAVDAWEDIQKFLGKEFIDSFIKLRYEHFLKIQLIVEKTSATWELKKKDSDQLRRTKFLPSNFQLRRTSNFIYGNKVAMISMNRKEPMGIIVEDPDIVHTMTVYFENLWNQSTD